MKTKRKTVFYFIAYSLSPVFSWLVFSGALHYRSSFKTTLVVSIIEKSLFMVLLLLGTIVAFIPLFLLPKLQLKNKAVTTVTIFWIIIFLFCFISQIFPVIAGFSFLTILFTQYYDYQTFFVFMLVYHFALLHLIRRYKPIT